MELQYSDLVCFFNQITTRKWQGRVWALSVMLTYSCLNLLLVHSGVLCQKASCLPSLGHAYIPFTLNLKPTF